MAKAKIVKSVSFNSADPTEKELLNHMAAYPNFSGYIKTLIRGDMLSKKPEHAILPVKPAEFEEIAANREQIHQETEKRRKQPEKAQIIKLVNSGGLKIDLRPK